MSVVDLVTQLSIGEPGELIRQSCSQERCRVVLQILVLCFCQGWRAAHVPLLQCGFSVWDMSS